MKLKVALTLFALTLLPTISRAQVPACRPATDLAAAVGCFVGTDTLEDGRKREVRIKLWLDNGLLRGVYRFLRIPNGNDRMLVNGKVIAEVAGRTEINGNVHEVCVTGPTSATFAWFNDHEQFGVKAALLLLDGGKVIESPWEQGKGRSERVDDTRCADLKPIDEAIWTELQKKRARAHLP